MSLAYRLWRLVSIGQLGLLLLPPLTAAKSLDAQVSKRLQIGSPDIRPRLDSGRVTFTIAPPAPAYPTILSEHVYSTVRDGRPLLAKATLETGVDGVGGDTLLMDPATLAPVDLVTFGGGRTRRFHFAGRRVTGEIIDSAGTRTRVDTLLAEPAFAGPAFFTVLRALPIGPTLDVTVPFFRPYDRTLVAVRYRSLGVDSVTIHSERLPVQRVLGEIDGNLALYWLRDDTHELIRVTTFAPNAYGPINMTR
jgi:hypothetical protein